MRKKAPVFIWGPYIFCVKEPIRSLSVYIDVSYDILCIAECGTNHLCLCYIMHLNIQLPCITPLHW